MLGLGNSLIIPPVLSGYTNTHFGEFNGTSFYVETNTSMQAILRDNFTIAFWVRLDDGVNNPPQTFIGCNAAGSLPVAVEGFAIYIGKNNPKLSLRLVGGSDVHHSISDAAVFVNGVNDWKHIAITFTKGDPGVELMYVDGSLIASSISGGLEITSEKQEAITLAANEAFIGAISNVGTAAEFVRGGMDEIAVWSSALPPGMIAKIAVAGADLLSVAATDLEHWYQLNNDVTDATGNSDGTNHSLIFGTSVAT